MHWLCRIADKCRNNSPQDILKTRFLSKETHHIKDMGGLLQQYIQVSKQPGLGLYLLDSELRDSGGETPWGSANEPDASDQRLLRVTEHLYKIAV